MWTQRLDSLPQRATALESKEAIIFDRLRPYGLLSSSFANLFLEEIPSGIFEVRLEAHGQLFDQHAELHEA